MEVDEIEMTKEELQQWIRTKVMENKMISTDMQEKRNLLKSLLERREKQAFQLRKLCQSVAACEELVRKQYSLLGWEYPDSDDNDDDKSITGGGNTSPSQREFKPEPVVCSSPTTNGCTPLLPKQEDSDIKDHYRYKGKNIFVNPKLRPVVVLIRPPRSSLSPPLPQTCDSDDKSFNSSDSSALWEPDEDSSDSDDSVSSFDGAPKKRRRIDGKFAGSHVTPQASTNTGAKSNAAKTSAPQTNDKSNAVKTSPQANDKSNAAKTSAPQTNDKSKAVKTSPQANDKSNAAKTSAPQTNDKSNAAKTSPQANIKSNAANMSTPQASVKSNATKTSTPQTSTSTKAKSNTLKTWALPANTKGVTPAGTVSTPSQSFHKAPKTQDAPSGPQGAIRVNMNVLARRKAMRWQQGKIAEIVTQENGKLKYKINFENGKSLVSGHHIAYDCMAKANKLSVGTRVVVKSKDENSRFYPGIVAEVPSRKNRLRFLIFLDDLTPVYVGLPLLYLVCRPLANPLDDITDDNSKKFLKEYIESWPYPPQTQYRAGQMINAELNGIQQRCEVLVVDSSIIQVLFQKDKCKEWLYRGSPRLEHMVKMREHLESKKEEEQKNKSTSVNASSKSAH